MVGGLVGGCGLGVSPHQVGTVVDLARRPGVSAISAPGSLAGVGMVCFGDWSGGRYQSNDLATGVAIMTDVGFAPGP